MKVLFAKVISHIIVSILIYIFLSLFINNFNISEWSKRQIFMMPILFSVFLLVDIINSNSEN